MDRANYTMFFYQYIDAIGGRQNLPSQDIESIPIWDNSNFLDRLIDRFKYREIGSETVELFTHNWKNTCKEVMSLYNKKLLMQIEKFDDLYSRIITENGTITDELYYNPINGNNEKLQSKTKNTYEKTRSYGFLYNNAQIMKAVNDVEIIFEKMTEYFEPLFMAVV